MSNILAPPGGYRPTTSWEDDIKVTPILLTYLQQLEKTLAYANRKADWPEDVTAADNKIAKNLKQYQPRGKVIRRLKQLEILKQQKQKLTNLVKGEVGA